MIDKLIRYVSGRGNNETRKLIKELRSLQRVSAANGRAERRLSGANEVRQRTPDKTIS
jgi:hypothetical protein